MAVDDKGRQVTGLAAADFKIIDNGQERKPEFVTYVATARSPTNSPISGHPFSIFDTRSWTTGRDFKQAERDISFNASSAELETARRDGVLSTFSFEGEKPGFYRISVAVRDNYSGKTALTCVL